jgi:predicted  nucleic acid-binding Zn-ribbon protein
MTDSIEHLDAETQKYIRDLRAENARFRTEKNDLSTKYTEAGNLIAEANTKLDGFAKLQGEHEKFLADNAKLQDSYNRVSAAAKHKLDPDEWGDRLKGSTLEELIADAAKIAPTVSGKPSIPVDPAAGGAPPAAPTVDPITAAFKRAGL